MTSHVASARRRGLSGEQIDAIGTPDTWPHVFDERERLVLRLADEVSGATSHALTPELVTGLRSHFAEEALAELVLVAGQANLNNRAGNAAKQLLGTTP